MAANTCTNDTSSIQPPVRQMYPVSPTVTPLSMTSALSEGR